MGQIVLCKPKKIYCCKLKNKEMLMESQSGGAFSAVAEYFLKKGSVIYGCTMEKSKAVYIRIDNLFELRRVKGSKYVQADMADAFSQIKNDLAEGKIVLFSGTPCYVMAVNKYFEHNENYANLYTIDLICHGVPSPRVFRQYLEYLEKKKKKRISDYIFRDKKKDGWHKHVEKIMYENGEVEYRDGYTQLFYTNHTLRESCGNCRFSSMQRCGDFTVGDYWGVESVFPEFDDNKGVSLLFLNSNRALESFGEFKDLLEYIEINEEMAARQPNLISHSVIPANNDKFWMMFQKKGVGYCINFWSPAGIPFRIKRKIKSLISKIHC